MVRLYQKYLKGKELTEAMKHLGRTEGVITDPVYEGKSIPALIDLVREDHFPAGSKVLYVHLGGQPAINAYTTAF